MQGTLGGNDRCWHHFTCGLDCDFLNVRGSTSLPESGSGCRAGNISKPLRHTRSAPGRLQASGATQTLTMNIYTHSQDPGTRAALEKFESRLVQ